MPACFTRLRLVGFKSFAEPVSIEIQPGLTGIVGPNGCGKSNLVEALRFVMGESSARSLRSGEIEGVIFAGTAARPARNLAEVQLALEAGETPLPVPFHTAADLLISRGVERGRGSTFRINGREVRGRDVQTLFADLGSGARASAIVTQGRITQLIAERPEERRALLEEAAGITGLYARRHEAELKLAQAEANLARAQELRAELEAQLAGLRRQARQAARYRNLGGAIRAAETELLAIERARVLALGAEREQALRAARLALAGLTLAAEVAATDVANAQALLPPARESEAGLRTGLERARLARGEIQAEESRLRAALQAATTRLAELERDLAHGALMQQDAGAALARLAEETAKVALRQGSLPDALAAAAAGASEAARVAAAAEAEADRTSGTAAAVLARARVLAEERSRLEERGERLSRDAAGLAAEQARLAKARVDPGKLAAAAAREAAAGDTFKAARAAREHQAGERNDAARALETARETLAAREAERTRLAAETEALAAVLATGRATPGEPALVDTLSVPAGLEGALSAAFGEALEAACSAWRVLPPAAATNPLPATVIPLETLIEAPPALSRALPGIGLVETSLTAERLQPALAPGQALVTREGGLWRWDGYSVPPGAGSHAALRMVARNRLAVCRERLATAEAAACEARARRDGALAADAAAAASSAAAEIAAEDAGRRLRAARETLEALRRDAAAAEALGAALAANGARIGSERSELEAALARLAEECAGLPDPAEARLRVEAARQALAAAREEERQARAAEAALSLEATELAGRESEIAREKNDWGERSRAAEARATELAERRRTLALEHAELAVRPAELAGRAAAAVDALESAEAAHLEAARALATAGERAETASRRLRAAEREQAGGREAVLLADAASREALAALAALDARALERLGPEIVLPARDGGENAEAAARQRLERLLREREAMGPVNLRAEIEAAEIENRVSLIDRETLELNGAIAKLRGSIGHLNREGRTRLSATFTEVDRHFQTLFRRMFGGGRAHLALVGAEDPLAAGLEIYAEPPGKKLSQLSLLSGGEQALVALSLVFAVFRCSPAPIAVLDEVDAPLDDVNVGRFCALIEDVVRERNTRMLIATHHPLTMARMDRLYGVTMQERGVSRVLSVDLAAAEQMADPPRLAAE